MDWFERITGFREQDPARTRAQLKVEGQTLVSLVDGSRHGIGRLTLPSLHELRTSTVHATAGGTRSTVRNLVGDARALHRDPAFAGALFQVASQFNLLEMVGPDVSPDDGVTRYQHDRTQGPACAMAAGAATIYRNYFVPVGDAVGQTAARQLDALAPLGEALAQALDRPVASLWTMRNGYALCSADGLQAIGGLLRAADEALKKRLRGELRIGLHAEVEVTDIAPPGRPQVSQAFCSALPVAYTRVPAAAWAPFAQLVLEAAYETTLLAAVERRQAGGSATVLLTRLGGGAFGNDDAWIDAALEWALGRVADAGLDVRLVHYAAVPPTMVDLARRFG
jgi:hypothetical protein